MYLCCKGLVFLLIIWHIGCVSNKYYLVIYFLREELENGQAGNNLLEQGKRNEQTGCCRIMWLDNERRENYNARNGNFFVSLARFSIRNKTNINWEGYKTKIRSLIFTERN